MNVLIIDSSDNKQITVGLEIDGEEYENTKKITSGSSQVVLPMINSILKKHKLSLKDIYEIEVNTGPGSYTGLRVGIAIANALSFTLRIPVNGKKIGNIISPKY